MFADFGAPAPPGPVPVFDNMGAPLASAQHPASSNFVLSSTDESEQPASIIPDSLVAGTTDEKSAPHGDSIAQASITVTDTTAIENMNKDVVQPRDMSKE